MQIWWLNRIIRWLQRLYNIRNWNAVPADTPNWAWAIALEPPYPKEHKDSSEPCDYTYIPLQRRSVLVFRACSVDQNAFWNITKDNGKYAADSMKFMVGWTTQTESKHSCFMLLGGYIGTETCFMHLCQAFQQNTQFNYWPKLLTTKCQWKTNSCP